MLLAPVPLTVVYGEIASEFAMCLKPKENQCILHAFDVLDGFVRAFVSFTTLLRISSPALGKLVPEHGWAGRSYVKLVGVS